MTHDKCLHNWVASLKRFVLGVIQSVADALTVTEVIGCTWKIPFLLLW